MPYDQNKDVRTGAAPGRSGFSVTLSDTVDLSRYAKALYIGGAGDVVVLPVENADGDSLTFKAHPIGYLPCSVRRVYSTGTTAAFILGLD